MKSSTDRRALLALAALAPLSFGACASTHEVPPPSPDVTVTALLYSGRANPRAALGEAQVAELAERVAGLPANPDFEGSTVVPSILGYAGVVVSNGAGAAGLPRHLAVSDGNVELGFGRERSFRRDPNGALEDWLVTQLTQAKRLTDAELRMIRGE